MWLCLWRWVDVSLIYHGGGEIVDFPVFFWGGSFFSDVVSHVGGAGRYLAALLAQSLNAAWLGAGVLTAQAWLIGTAGAAVLRALGCPGLMLVRFAPALLLMALYGRYAHFSEAVTALGIGLLAAVVWLRFSPGLRWARLVVLVVSAVALYCGAGAAVVVFSLMTALVAAGRGYGVLAVLFPLALAGLVPGLAGWLLFGLGPGEAFSALVPVSGERVSLKPGWVPLLVGLFALLPAVGSGAVLWRMLSRRTASTASTSAPVNVVPGTSPVATPQPRPARLTRARTGHGAHAPSRRRAWPFWRWTLQTAGSVLAAVGVLFLAHDRQLQTVLTVDRCVYEGRWADVPSAATGHPPNLYVTAALAQAAFHNGQLTRELPAVRKPGDLLLHDQTRRAHWNKAWLYWDLGYVNQALHHLAEAQEFCGPQPALLRRLAVIHLALTNLPTARIYFNALTRVPFHSAWARAYLARLDADPGLSNDAEVARLRRFMLRRDSVQLVWSPEEVLTLLLEANPQNRMAFEYLITCRLLAKDLKGFARDLERLDAFPGTALPPLWEEALLLAANQPGAPPDLRQRSVSPATHRRLAQVLQTIQACGGNPETAARQLAPTHGQTYFYYYLFNP